MCRKMSEGFTGLAILFWANEFAILTLASMVDSPISIGRLCDDALKYYIFFDI